MRIRQQTLKGSLDRIVCIDCFMIDDPATSETVKAGRAHVRETGHTVDITEYVIRRLTPAN